MKQPKAKHDRSLQARALRRVLRYVRPYTPLLGLSLILNLLTVGLSLLVPILICRCWCRS